MLMDHVDKVDEMKRERERERERERAKEQNREYKRNCGEYKMLI